MAWRRRSLILGIVSVALGGLITLGAFLLYQWKMPRVRERIIEILSTELGSTVELGDVHVSLGSTVRITAAGLVLHHRLYTDVPPLVRVDTFVIEAPLTAIARTPIHITSIAVTGLHIFIPPRREGDPIDTRPSLSSRLGGPSPVVVDQLTADGTLLEIGSKRADHLPRTFQIHRLRLTAAAFDRPTNYDAELTNPTPAGLILAHGTFGPWQAEVPSLTPLTGAYTFNADLGTINGIGGRLDSTGSFAGRLDQIVVKGTTKTPDFSLNIGGEPLPLNTTFNAIVDGTSGDTVLDAVEATLGRTALSARGGIVHMPGQKDRTVELDVKIERGRIEDVLRLALKDEPPDMSGGLQMTTHLELPPGSARVPLRLALTGDFRVASARFSSNTVQSKIDELSRRGRGRPGDAKVANVASNLGGAFQLRNGTLRLNRVSFAVNGATIRLDGTYLLTRRTLDFVGTARLDARASQMVTGWKRFPLKILDPLLARDGAGTLLPIRVSGPVSHPDFKVEVKKIFRSRGTR
jgi:hypothetical protein